MNKTFSKQELTAYSKDTLIELFMYQQQQLAELNAKMDILIEQISISKQQRFGRSSEKLELDEDQLSMCFNEAEVVIAGKFIVEPELEEVITTKSYTRKKPKGKREEDLKDLPVNVIRHELSDAQLKSIFGEKWKQLPDEVYKRLKLIPAQFEVEEHHVSVYAGLDNQTIIRADRPADLLRNSIVTPSLLASIINSKYVNAVPLYRLSQEFLRLDVNISRQVMAGWIIKCTERYLSLLYDRMHQELFKSKVIQADETPLEVTKDGRTAGSKSYMWVYRTGKMHEHAPVILYEYQRTRNSSHPETFLKGFNGTLVCDGYQVYHKIARENPDIEVAGCWSHARRRFANVVKSVKAIDKGNPKEALAKDALKQIALIYKTENELSELQSDERLRQRQLLVKPLVDAFFAWVNSHQHDIPAKSETGKGFTYCLNQEVYLRAFLDNGMVPMDNNATEAAIRGFCIGKKNWVLIDTIDGAKASATVYSIAETAKANNLKPYHYFKYILEEIPKHMDEKDISFLDNLLPWSDQLPDECKKLEK